MRRFKYVLLSSLLCILSFIMHAQGYRTLKPQWMRRLPHAYNDTYVFQSVNSSSYSLEDARKLNVSNLLSESGLKTGMAVISTTKSNESVSQVWQNGHLTETVTNSANTINEAKSKEIVVHAALIDEYWTQNRQGEYELCRLYAKSEIGKMPLYDNWEVTSQYYDCSGLWRSAIVPGWGQMYKGSYLKGGLVLGGFVGCIAGVVFTGSQRGVYLAKVGKTHDANAKKSYINSASNLATGRNVCIGAAAALYVYGLIDAIVAPGARRVVITPSADSRSVGVSASVRF